MWNDTWWNISLFRCFVSQLFFGGGGNLQIRKSGGYRQLPCPGTRWRRHLVKVCQWMRLPYNRQLLISHNSSGQFMRYGSLMSAWEDSIIRRFWWMNCVDSNVVHLRFPLAMGHSFCGSYVIQNPCVLFHTTCFISAIAFVDLKVRCVVRWLCCRCIYRLLEWVSISELFHGTMFVSADWKLALRRFFCIFSFLPFKACWSFKLWNATKDFPGPCLATQNSISPVYAEDNTSDQMVII